MEIDEEYLEFCLDFKVRRRNLMDESWFKEQYADNKHHADYLLDLWHDTDYDLLRSIACLSSEPDWQNYMGELKQNYTHYHQMRNRMREEQNG